MPQPTARVTDMHVCPMMTPGLPPVPHVGGPLLPPGSPSVLIGGLPAAASGLRHFVPDEWMPLLWEVLKFLYANGSTNG